VQFKMLFAAGLHLIPLWKLTAFPRHHGRKMRRVLEIDGREKVKGKGGQIKKDGRGRRQLTSLLLNSMRAYGRGA